MPALKDLTGRKFGRLTVIKRADDYVSPKGFHQIQYLCLCICGRTKIVPAQYLRTSKNPSCGCCFNEKISLQEWCLNNGRTDLLDQWHPSKNVGLSPLNISPYSNIKIWWLGKCGHDWQVSVNNRTGNNTGCPYCSNKKVLIGFNDLSTTDPDLIVEWDYDKNPSITPKMITRGSNKKVWWKCKEGHEWQAIIADRLRLAGRGCPYCSGRLAIEGENDLVTTHPDIIKEWNYKKNDALKIYPNMVKAGTNTKVWWKCKEGHEWEAQILCRTQQGTGCPYCSGRKILEGFNDLSTLRPDLLSEWNHDKNELKPNQVGTGAHQKVWWKCKEGHEWQAAIYCRNQGRGCPFCTNKKVLVGYNDFATKYPELLIEWNYEKNTNIKPTDIVYGSCKKVWWKCKKGHEWQAAIYCRNQGRGCPICHESSLEKSVRKYLEKKHYCYKEQIKFEDLTGLGKSLLSYDFGIFNTNLQILIECQGIQHYQPVDFFGGKEQFKIQQVHDDLKREYANKIGIPLIEIPYTVNSYEDIEEFLDERIKFSLLCKQK